MSAHDDRTAWQHAFWTAFDADHRAALQQAQCPDCGSPMTVIRCAGEVPGHWLPDDLGLRCGRCGLDVAVRVDCWDTGRVMGMIRGMDFSWSGRDDGAGEASCPEPPG